MASQPITAASAKHMIVQPTVPDAETRQL